MVRNKYRTVVMVNFLLVCLDDLGMTCEILNYMDSTFDFSYIPGAIVGFRSSLILLVVTSLRRIMYNDPRTLILPPTTTRANSIDLKK